MGDNNGSVNIHEAARIWCDSLHECAGYDKNRAQIFWERLFKCPGLYSEYLYYMVNQDFLCEYKIADVTIVDVMIWQLDHFKASMDMDREQKKNPDLMLLTAFETMLDMEQNPEIFLAKLRADTGTDYPDKY